MRTLGPCILGLWLGLSSVAEAAPTLDLLERVSDVQAALSRWDMDQADYSAARLLELHPNEPRALAAASRVAFHHADYEETYRLANAAFDAAQGDPIEEEMAGGWVAYLNERRPFWARFEEHRSESFILRVTERDRLLVPYALRALEASVRALGEDLGFCPSEPVVVEIYPNRSSFIGASTLSREEVETSGTVAICHFNRLMILSPAVMSRGYDWLDTLCHEYVHYAVYHLGKDNVPVWLHEGIAKVLESRWRLDEPEPLDPRLSSVLAEGRETGRWVTFEEMHPSMAKLPSAALVGLAFAQVAKGIEMLRAEGGDAAVAELIAAVHESGGDLDAALAATRGLDLSGFEERVRAHVQSADLYRIPGVKSFEELDELPFEFAPEGGGAPDEEAEVRGSIEDRQARDWVLIGDRLKGREHHEAAVIEYEKALVKLGQSEPLVVNRMALALLQLERIDAALPLLEELLRNHPTLTTTLDNLAEIHLRLADRAVRAGDSASTEAEHLERALELSRRSESVNPFNAEVHVRLVTLFRRLSLLDEAEASRERLRELRELN